MAQSTLGQIVDVPGGVENLPAERLPGVLAELAALNLRLAARLSQAPPPAPPATDAALLTVDAAAERLNTKPGHIRELIRKGELAAVDVGRYKRLEPSALEAYKNRPRIGTVNVTAGASMRRGPRRRRALE